MIEVHPNLFVGGAGDLIHTDDGHGGIKDGWFVVSSAKEPWHRQALGYTGRGAPKDDPEYLWAHRPNRLILNLVDVEDWSFIRPDIIDEAEGAIHAALSDGKKVLIHCNQGHSRAPTIAMLYMANKGPLAGKSHAEVVDEFKKLYPDYAPAKGMADYAANALTAAA